MQAKEEYNTTYVLIQDCLRHICIQVRQCITDKTFKAILIYYERTNAVEAQAKKKEKDELKEQILKRQAKLENQAKA